MSHPASVVTRVARAAYEAGRATHEPRWERLSTAERRTWERRARAAIAAMPPPAPPATDGALPGL